MKSATYSVVYLFGGFLTPISGAKITSGNAVPVKFQLKDALGNYISTARATLVLQKYVNNAPSGAQVTATSAGGSNVGNLFKYDPVSNQYVYSLNTKGLTTGTWQLRVSLDDGTTKTTFITLK